MFSRTQKLVLLLLGCIYCQSTIAGDLSDLPDNNKDLQRKIEALIRPNSQLSDALSLLTAFAFTCEKLKKQNETTWCHKTKGNPLGSVVRRYQVVIASEQGRVVDLKATTGLIGP